MMDKILVFVVLLVWATPAIALEFKGYPCTQDCSGHKAGYEWAQKKGLSEPEECGGNSNSFVEGCYAWVEEQGAAEKDEEDSSENEDTPEE